MSLFRRAMFRASASRQPSISFKNSTSTSDVPRLRLDAAYWSGAFDQYAASKRKRGTSEVDVEFLKEIEGWRDALARNMALRNKDIYSDDLNAAVQVTIDRVVFL